MEDKNVPYIVYEGTMARFERIVKRLMIMLIIAVVMLFASNAFWLYEWTAYDYADVSLDGTDGGNANYIGASGTINNGESKSQEESQEEPQESKGN